MTKNSISNVLKPLYSEFNNQKSNWAHMFLEDLENQSKRFHFTPEISKAHIDALKTIWSCIGGIMDHNYKNESQFNVNPESDIANQNRKIHSLGDIILENIDTQLEEELSQTENEKNLFFNKPSMEAFDAFKNLSSIKKSLINFDKKPSKFFKKNDISCEKRVTSNNLSFLIKISNMYNIKGYSEKQNNAHFIHAKYWGSKELCLKMYELNSKAIIGKELRQIVLEEGFNPEYSPNFFINKDWAGIAPHIVNSHGTLASRAIKKKALVSDIINYLSKPTIGNLIKINKQ